MSTPREPMPVMLVAGILRVPEVLRDEVHACLAAEFGAIAESTEEKPFLHTRYYEAEMGPGLLRQYVAFERLIDPGQLAAIKLKTNEMEGRWQAAGRRRVNIDPGLLTDHNLILATGKDYAHRIYLGEGIYAEVTLYAHGGGLSALPWTYPDYREAETIAFFERQRQRLRVIRRGFGQSTQ
ncbi:MAG: DUF4416 family protein [bacterium]|nr:DUF4416 family protein [bacterium]